MFRESNITFRFSLLSLCVVAMTGCSFFRAINPFDSPPSRLQSLAILRTPGSNSNKYIQADMVIVYDEDIASKLLPKVAEAWFNERDAFLGLSKKLLNVISIQPVPISKVSEVKLPKKTNQAQVVVIFIAYFYENKYFKLDLTQVKHARIDFEEKPHLKIIDK